MSFTEGMLLKASGAEVYVVEGGRRRWLTSPARVEEHGGFGRIQSVSDAELQTLPLGAPVGSPDGYMFQGSGPEVYLVEKGQRRWLTSPARVEDYGGFHRVIRIADENLRSLPLGAPVGVAPDGVLFKGTGPKVYVMEGGQRRWVPDPAILETLGGWPRVITIDDKNLNSVPEGTPLPIPIPGGSQPLEVSKPETVGNQKFMRTTATLYRNGQLSVSAYSESQHPSEGLRGRVYIVCVDDRGRAHWASQELICTTRGSLLDLFTPSRGTNYFSEQYPEPVGRLTARLDIYHSTGPLGDPLAGLKNVIKGTQDVYEEIKPFLEQLY